MQIYANLKEYVGDEECKLCKGSNCKRCKYETIEFEEGKQVVMCKHREFAFEVLAMIIQDVEFNYGSFVSGFQLFSHPGDMRLDCDFYQQLFDILIIQCGHNDSVANFAPALRIHYDSLTQSCGIFMRFLLSNAVLPYLRGRSLGNIQTGDDIDLYYADEHYDTLRAKLISCNADKHHENRAMLYEDKITLERLYSYIEDAFKLIKRDNKSRACKIEMCETDEEE